MVAAMTKTTISLDRWYAVAVANGQERTIQAAIRKVIADHNLGREVKDVVLPDQEEIADAGTPKARPVMRNKLPGYLLLRGRELSPTTIAKITKVKNVMEFMGGNDHPTQVPPGEVRRILGKDSAVAGGVSSRPRFVAGDVVKVVRGPMADFTGPVVEVNAAKHKLVVTLEIFGRETPAELTFDDVRSA